MYATNKCLITDWYFVAYTQAAVKTYCIETNTKKHDHLL